MTIQRLPRQLARAHVCVECVCNWVDVFADVIWDQYAPKALGDIIRSHLIAQGGAADHQRTNDDEKGYRPLRA